MRYTTSSSPSSQTTPCGRAATRSCSSLPLVPIETLPPGEYSGFYVREWNIDRQDFNRLKEYLREHDQSFIELEHWEPHVLAQGHIVVRFVASGTYRLVVRSCGDRTYSDSVIIPDKDLKTFVGVYHEFLEGLKIVSPRVAKEVKVCFLDGVNHFPSNRKMFHYLYSALLELFDTQFLLNRHISFPPKEFFNRHAQFCHDQAPEFFDRTARNKMTCSTQTANTLRSFFIDVLVWAWDNTVHDTIKLELSTIMIRMNDATPLRFQGRTLTVLFGAQMDPDDRAAKLSFHKGNSPASMLTRWVLEGFQECEGLEAPPDEEFLKRYLNTVLPFICLTMGKRMADIIRKLPLRELQAFTNRGFLNAIGEARMMCCGGLHFIHIPLLDPERIRYGGYDDSPAFLNLWKISWVNIYIVGDIVMKSLEKHHHHISDDHKCMWWDEVDKEVNEFYHTGAGSFLGRSLKSAQRDYMDYCKKHPSLMELEDSDQGQGHRGEGGRLPTPVSDAGSENLVDEG
ncbi:Uu.00g113740.m01.CDS01 [Anthostomella pinea]|uniref:Uu.00g113740.m01.CDS01 n=1 Tax=Anthostomella pinea TaxID=933095 RepID=A0AAI8VFJ7_9PEZI|nr:Uu.00g113740.m01.CDS01 [Anthostomella pinea]